MQFWKSASETRRPRFCSSLSILVLAIVLTAPVMVAAATPWLWQPWITATGGHESDIVLDPEFTRTLVPGGTFAGISPGFRLSRRVSPTLDFRLLNRTTLERFFNDDQRTLFGTAFFGDLRFAGRSPWRARATLSGDYFDDSGSDTFRRVSGGADLGAGATFRRWSFEVSGYAQGRSYPLIETTSAAGTTEDYTERHLGFGVKAAWNLADGLVLSGRYSGRDTDASDPLFDSRSGTYSVTADYNFRGGSWISSNYTHQDRSFANRTVGIDEDSYDQFGVGVGRGVSRRLDAVVRYAHARYVYPEGGEESSDRFSIALTWQFGRSAPSIPRVPPRAGTRPDSARRPAEAIRFRIEAPDATSVSLVGSFNGWDPRANPLTRVSGGWWETELVLPEGTHEFVYLVDGEPTLPADVTPTVDDGFGGHNGIIVILASDL